MLILLVINVPTLAFNIRTIQADSTTTTLPAVVRGNTLVADQDRVIELDSVGDIVWQISGLNGASDVERLPNGNTLIVEADADRVIEVDQAGDLVWQYAGLSGVTDAERLPNGNTLISEFFGWRVIEVNSAGDVVWQTTDLANPEDVDYLPNGNILVSLWNSGLVIEVNRAGNVIWSCATGAYICDADRLLNGNTLITKSIDNRVIEVDPEGNIVWEVSDLDFPCDAERLSDGNTLIADLENYRIVEVDSAGGIIWEITGLHHPSEVERTENPWRERTVGVQVGDWAKYSVDTSWAGTLSPYLEMWARIEWGMIEVTNVQGTVITFTGTTHLKNGSALTTPGAQWDIAPTGSFGFIFWFIGSNLQAGDKVYPSGSTTINETVAAAYFGVPREVNCLNASTPFSIVPGPPYDLTGLNCYWDQATGILTEELLECSTEDLTSSLSIHLEMVDTNLWEGSDLLGDINRDGIVDISDVIIWAHAFGCTPLEPDWDLRADLTQDKLVDIYDAVLIAVNFGTTWTP